MQSPLRACAVLFLSALLPCLSALGQNESASPKAIAFERARHLQHGINTSIWFAQSSDYSLHRLQTFTTADDIALIERMGFDH